MNNNDNNTITPLETELLAALRRCVDEVADHTVASGQARYKQARAAIAKAEAKVAAFEADQAKREEARDEHHWAHLDGFHDAAPEPRCAACQRIERLKVYAQDELGWSR